MVILQLVDRSLAHAEGVIEDVSGSPFILKRPFLATGRAIIDVCEGKMMMRVGDRVEVSNVYKPLRFLAHYEKLSMISMVESDATSLVPYMSPIHPLERALIGDEEDSEDEMMEEIEQELDRPVTLIPPKPSIEKAPKLELKPLPVHLRYTYLGNSEIFPVIISSILTNIQEEKLLRVLRMHKKAIRWTIADIKGISPSFCMHKIFLEDGNHPSVEQQRRLNPIMKEVVKKEIVICPKDQEKTTFTCSYGTFAFRRMPFDLCNVPATFQRCMMAIFTNMVESFVEVFMDDFSVFGLLEKDVTFNFNDACMKAFEKLKKKLVTALIIVASDWSLPFEFMCDASDHAIGAVLSQWKDKVFYSIYYAKEGGQIKEAFPDEQLFAITQDPPPWYADYVNYLVGRVFPPEIESEARKRFLHDVNFYYWDEPYLYKQCANHLMRRSLFKDAHAFVKKCDQCQRTGTIIRRHEIPLNNILGVEIFDVWGIDFTGSFPLSRGNKYIFLVVDYVSKWVEVIALPTNDVIVVATFVKKNIFSRFGTPRALISD
ncbi:uncharacterized protein [Nicotiana sylvestris]|uniref:uncharacterized protein n=1 Tax=Nicotiana sylvestris TaxID=4096 RepID=UPI00388CA736